MKNIQQLLNHVCLAKVVANHLAGKEHKMWHRGVIGIFFMLTGVIIAKHFGESTYHVVAVAGDALGYSLHGIGLVPFIEALIAEA